VIENCKRTFDVRKKVCQNCRYKSDCATERLMQAIFGKDYKRKKVAKNGTSNEESKRN